MAITFEFNFYYIYRDKHLKKDAKKEEEKCLHKGFSKQTFFFLGK